MTREEECRFMRERERGRGSQGWLVLTLFCLLLASCCFTFASARLLPELQEVRSRDAMEEVAVASGQQSAALLDGSQLKPDGESKIPAARALREQQGDRFLLAYFTADYADPKPDPHPDPSRPPMIPHPYVFRSIP